MNFDSAITSMNRLLAKKEPQTFNRAWVRANAPRVYRYVQKEIRIEGGGIDWDRITRALNPRYQRQWTGSLRLSNAGCSRTVLDELGPFVHQLTAAIKSKKASPK